jgi:MFS family permease
VTVAGPTAAIGAKFPGTGRARVSISVMFAIHGAVFGTFATRIPWIADRLRLGSGHLGVALMAPALGAFIGMPFAGRLIHRFGGRTSTRAMMVVWCVAGALPPFAPDLPLLVLFLAIYGLSSGMADIAMNAQAIPIERQAGKSIMSGLHGMWSVGGLIASGLGVAAAHKNTDARLHLALVAIVLVTVAIVAGAKLPPNEADVDEPAPPRFTLPPRGVWLIGLLAFASIFAEGSCTDWSAVYLKKVLQAGPGTAAIAFSAFAFAMAGTRLGGDFAVRRLGPVRTVQVSGTIGTAGGLLVVLAHTQLLAIVGFAFIGLGIAAVVPLAFAAAGHADAHPARAIAGVATIAYGAGLAAPGLVGGIASVTSLRTSFMLVTVLVVLVALGAGYLRPAPGAPGATPAPGPPTAPPRTSPPG